MTQKRSILFLCTGNSCRSQMAEGFLRAIWGDTFDSYSAGTSPKGIDPRAVTAMSESGIDISTNVSQTISDHAGISFDMVVTVCGKADTNCPIFPGDTIVIHVGFDDPPHLAQGAPDEETALASYRRVRDEIKLFITDFPQFYFRNQKGVK